MGVQPSHPRRPEGRWRSRYNAFAVRWAAAGLSRTPYGRWRSLYNALAVLVVAAGLYAFVSSAAPRESQPIRLLLAMDLSESMNCPVAAPAAEPGEPLDPRCANPGDPDAKPPKPLDKRDTENLRIGAAVNGAIDGLGWFGQRDRLGVWTFSGQSVVDRLRRKSSRLDQAFSGKRTDSEPSGDFPSFEPAAAEPALRGLLLKASGGTPLNLAIYYGVRALRAYWQPGVNALVILTDGYDHTSELNGATLDEARLNRLLNKGLQPPVHVLLTTAGDDVDCTKLLTKITAFAYDPGRDCFPVRRGRDVATTFERVGERLRELARGP